MSYSLLVQGDNPISYLKLNGSDSGSSSVTISNPQWTTPPLVANSASALLVKSGGASVSLYNAADALYKNYENSSLYLELWFSFNGLLDGSGYIKNLSSSSQYFISNQLNIVRMMSGSTEVGALLYDYNKNTFRFKINGTDNSDAFIPVRNLNNSFYIIAGYNARGLSIFVNGERGVSGVVNDTSLFPSKSSASINFLINGNSLNSSASMNYVINNFAVYDYEPSMTQKRKRVLMAFSDSKPVTMTGYQSTSYFDIYEKTIHPIHMETVSGENFNNYINSFNLKVDPTFGIVPNNISDFELSDQSSSTASVSYSANGASISGVGSLIFQDFGKIVGETDSILITAQVTRGSASSDYIFSFKDSNTNSLIYSTIESSGFKVFSYDFAAASSTQILYASSTLSSGSTYNFAFSTYGGEMYLYGNLVSASTEYSIINVENDTSLEVGNVLSLSSSSPTLTLKNVGVSNFQQNDFSSLSFTSNLMYMARLSSNLGVSQIQTWTKRIPVSNYGTEIVGSKVTWDSMDNCMVETSSDNGLTWQTIRRGDSLSNFSYGQVQNDVFIKVTIPFEYSLESVNQSFSDIDIMLYKDLSFLSTDLKYYMTFGKENSSLPAYNIQRNSQSILMRKNNFGIKFDSVSGSVNGYATITSNTSASSFESYAIDFWINFANTSSTSYVISSTASSGVQPALYASAGKLINTTGSLYVNGSYYASNTFTVTANESYHIFYNFGSQFTGSAIYINGSPTLTHSNATYSSINLWDYAVGSLTPFFRHQVFTGNNITSVTDSLISSALWQPNWSSSSVISASGYKIG